MHDKVICSSQGTWCHFNGYALRFGDLIVSVASFKKKEKRNCVACLRNYEFSMSIIKECGEKMQMAFTKNWVHILKKTF